jgi:hypothetical protein
MDEQALMRLHRRAQCGYLGVGRMLAEQRALGQKGGRRLSVDAILKRDDIAQMVIYLRAMYPARKLKAIVYDVAKFHRVQRSYVYKCLAETGPERRENMVPGVTAFIKWWQQRAGPPTGSNF